MLASPIRMLSALREVAARWVAAVRYRIPPGDLARAADVLARTDDARVAEGRTAAREAILRAGTDRDSAHP